MSFPGTSLPAQRERADACPGALQTHAAADGGLARVRVPGGAIGAVQLQALAAAARELGNGHLELTSRGNVQLRGLPAGAEAELGDRLAAAGLLPSATHERVRNVLASTLSGRTPGGHVDARPWVGAFDAGLRADPALAELPGRFLLTLDDGRGDVAGLGGDVGLLALSAGSVALLLGGVDSGLRCAPDDAVALALDATHAFLAERAAQGSTAWRLAELADGPTRVATRLRGQSRDFGPSVEVPGAPVVGPVGAATQLDGRTALIGVVPLGRLTADQADLLARLAADVQLTPWRSVVVPDLAEDAVDDAAVDLFRTGMVFDEASPWLQVTTCAGRPGCAKSLADVRADAVTAVSTRTLPAGGARQHWAGCERRCGRPQGGVVDVVATPSGYELRIEED
ncbi:precorrin-3B synthase [Modestobacter sp. VKM Ac-2984]|uniref:precorrin-3B synthase n=1 Tax=Modestobacter sp. VKM Ac-2984 TaxID=3004138 RepID=UPI0022AAA021|nr:precorrin-3B synthase [Modestobacter sp. VKM Ac-2984]MCZ2817536.1 precorrin-3B synthase [Modestobacter sp. VKM Ac-2984]